MSEETHALTEKSLYWEGAPRRRQEGEGTQEAPHVAHGLRVCGDGFRFRVVFAQSL